MSYIINNSRGQIVAVVGDGTVNTTATDLSLVGRAVTNYGEYQNENYVYLLENFANNTAPTQPILGQLWYNSDTDILSAYSTANTWVALATQNYVEAAKISPVFTGVPTAPTAPAGTANTQIATTAFVQGEKVSPAFTGVPIAPTAAPGTNTTQIATTEFVTSSVQLTGVPTAPTAPLGTSTTQIATTEFVSVSPQFTGVPTAPTPSLGTANTQLATTGFVVDALSYPGGLLGSMAQQNQTAVNITGGNITGLNNPLPIASGGTDANNAVNARTNLGVAIGIDVQAYDIELAALASTVSAADQVPYYTGIGTASTYTAAAYMRSVMASANAANARSNLGLGSIAIQNANSVDIQGTVVITAGEIQSLDAPVPVAQGGTGATDPLGARNNLGITAVFDSLGTMSNQNANSVTITGGSITGITPLLVNAGGTGAANAADARSNLQAAWSGTSIIAGTGLSGGGTLASNRTLSIAANSNGYGTRYISTSTPTGGNDGDIWYQI